MKQALVQKVVSRKCSLSSLKACNCYEWTTDIGWYPCPIPEVEYTKVRIPIWPRSAASPSVHWPHHSLGLCTLPALVRFHNAQTKINGVLTGSIFIFGIRLPLILTSLFTLPHHIMTTIYHCLAMGYSHKYIESLFLTKSTMVHVHVYLFKTFVWLRCLFSWTLIFYCKTHWHPATVKWVVCPKQCVYQ